MELINDRERYMKEPLCIIKKGDYYLFTVVVNNEGPKFIYSKDFKLVNKTIKSIKNGKEKKEKIPNEFIVVEPTEEEIKAAAKEEAAKEVVEGEEEESYYKETHFRPYFTDKKELAGTFLKYRAVMYQKELFPGWELEVIQVKKPKGV